MLRAVALAALLVSGCAGGVPPIDIPAVESDLDVEPPTHRVPICRPGYVNPTPYVTCITPRPSPG